MIVPTSATQVNFSTLTLPVWVSTQTSGRKIVYM